MEGNYDDILTMLRGEFVGEAEDNLNEIEILLQNLRANSEDPSDAIVKIQRPAHSLKGSSSVAEFPLVCVIMHRLEDYLAPIKKLEPQHIEDIQVFVDLAREYSAVDFDQTSVSTADLARQLPQRPSQAEQAQAASEGRKIEALMVIKEKTAGMIFERELSAAGMRVTTVRSSFEAFEMIVRTKPDLVIVSGVIDELSGIDIASAIKAMQPTKHIPVCLLTSYERDHHELASLPETVLLIQKSTMKEDLGNILSTIS